MHYRLPQHKLDAQENMIANNALPQHKLDARENMKANKAGVLLRWKIWNLVPEVTLTTALT